jgi:hypothetical protein
MDRRASDNSDKGAFSQTLVRILQEVQPVARELNALGVAHKNEQDDVLRMQEIEVGR